MSAAVAALHYYTLPWATSDDVRRFRRTLSICLGVVVLLGVVMPWLKVPPMIRVASKSPPPPLAHIVLEKPPLVIPPQPEIKVEPLPSVQPQPKVEKRPDVKPLPVLDKPVVAAPTVADARQKAAVSGLLQFTDSFADMRDAVDVQKLNDTGAIRRGTGEAATLDRALLTSAHGTRSAGVNVAGLSRATGGVALAGRETTKVDVPPGTIGAKGTHAVDPDHPEASNSNADARERSIEDIRRVFDSNKGAIFAIYNRALRQDPSLQGKVVLELQIDAQGHVLACRVVSSELADEGLMEKIVSRIRLFDFGKRDVGTTTISYPVQFLPT